MMMIAKKKKNVKLMKTMLYDEVKKNVKDA